MEISGNKYLHKKFKKQSSCPQSHNAEAQPHPNLFISAPDNVQRNEENEEKRAITSHAIVENDSNIFKDNKTIDCVPNYKSTNCEYSLAKTFKTDNVNRTYRSECQSSISNLDSTNNVNTIENETTLSNTISKTVTILPSSLLLVNDLKENHFSFDTKSSNSIDKSSSVDITNSKYSLLSERKNSVNVFQNSEVKSYNRNDGDTTLTSESVERKQSGGESTGGKYVCTYCNLACSKPSVLQKHIRAHTNERPYPCVSCGFSFKTRSNLYKHCRSRTHANRVMGNKHNQNSVESTDADSASERMDDKTEAIEATSVRSLSECSDVTNKSDSIHVDSVSSEHSNVWEQKQKPYKPKFHTAKLFFEENRKKSEVDIIKYKTVEKKNELTEPVHIKSNSDLLKLRINELISKNNSILSCDDSLLRKKSCDYNTTDNLNYHEPQVFWQQSVIDVNKTDEPLNLSSKNRKRCLSDSENSQKSLIKELLLKNLSSDPNLQCPYCRMIFQTVPELEMHKLKYCSCKGNNVRYARSSSVNVASILTHNKNAFDSIPHMQNTALSLKSPGPFLGKTRLIEGDRNEKYRTFSFDDNVIMNHTQLDSPNFTNLSLHSPSYPTSPHIKKNSVKLFGGEVKITQTSGETRSYKIESENMNKLSSEPHNFIEFGSKISENLVIKSSLQSGGTVLQNKSTYTQKMDNLQSPNLICYDNPNIVSSKINLSILNENKFSYDKEQNDRLLTFTDKKTINASPNTNMDNSHNTDQKTDDNDKDLFKTNLMNFSQKAIQLITPNLKPPTLAIPGLPIPNNEKIYSPIENNKDKQIIDNLNFAKKQISMQQKMFDVPASNIYNPVNLLVNGKVIRYVPGIPGPVADSSVDFPPVISTKPPSRHTKEMLKSPRLADELHEPLDRDVKVVTPTNLAKFNISANNEQKNDNKTTPTMEQHEIRPDVKSQVLIKIKSDFEKRKELEKNDLTKSIESKITPLSVSVSNIEKPTNEVKKFVRPNSLALKPSSVSFKSHHGLTPTMFNQALISPDTPRVSKKYCQQYLNGNYFSYLGLKSSTKSVYCTLNKTQPFYAKHFKKLSMYSEWRQQESKIDSLSVSGYDSRQKHSKYTMAGVNTADLIVHSSYKFVASEPSNCKEESSTKNSTICGGYESNEDYTYIRGRGRGRYVCDQCGIRCKKPSMLKKHIRTHSDDRPYTCQHCNFSFKTKGNLTKHMKSKAHSKKYAETSSTGTQNSISSSDSEDTDAESSDESTRLQEHEAAHCLLSLSQKTTLTQSMNVPENSTTVPSSSLHFTEFSNVLKDNKFLKNPDQITQVSNTNFAKNKIMDENIINFSASKHISEVLESSSSSNHDNISQYLGKSSIVRPLTYPYQQTHLDLESKPSDRAVYKRSPDIKQNKDTPSTYQEATQKVLLKSDKIISDTKNYNVEEENRSSPLIIRSVLTNTNSKNDFNMQNLEGNLPANVVFRKRKLSSDNALQSKLQRNEDRHKPIDLSSSVILSVSAALDLSSSTANTQYPSYNVQGKPKVIMNSSKTDISSNEPSYEHIRINERTAETSNTKMEHSYLSYISQVQSNSFSTAPDISNTSSSQDFVCFGKKRNDTVKSTDEQFSRSSCERQLEYISTSDVKSRHSSFSESSSSETFSQNSDINDRLHKNQEDILPTENHNFIYKTNISVIESKDRKISECEPDQSAMQTLAEIAINQMKTEKNIMAKNVASEYLKLALKNEYNANTDGSGSESGIKKFVNTNKETNELIVKPEENKNCSICSKNFSKPSQLRLHMNIHYLERPFRCESCAVSFRTRGHLQKHERSTTHHNKLSTSPALSSSEPRPFKCSDCNIAFRIHGHLAKHLRSKMHIMKLECLAKIPFGLYAELERANSLLTEINTTDGDLCLESLKILARKLFSNNPNKMDQVAHAPENRDS